MGRRGTGAAYRALMVLVAAVGAGGCAGSRAPAPRTATSTPARAPEATIRLLEVSCEGAPLRVEGLAGTRVRLTPQTRTRLEPIGRVDPIEGTVGDRGTLDLRVPLGALDPGTTVVRVQLWRPTITPGGAWDTWHQELELAVPREISALRLVARAHSWGAERWPPPTPPRVATLHYRHDSGCPSEWSRTLRARADRMLVAAFRSEPLAAASAHHGRVELSPQGAHAAELEYTLDPASMIADATHLYDGEGSTGFGWRIADQLHAVTGQAVEVSVALRITVTPEATNELLLAALQDGRLAAWSEPVARVASAPRPLLVVHREGEGLIRRTGEVRAGGLTWPLTLTRPVRDLTADEFLAGHAVKHAQLVAVVEHTGKPMPGACGRPLRSGPMYAPGHVYTSARVRVIEARSGRLVASRRFRGTPSDCDGRETHWIDFEQIRAYLRRVSGSQVEPRKPTGDARGASAPAGGMD